MRFGAEFRVLDQRDDAAGEVTTRVVGGRLRMTMENRDLKNRLDFDRVRAAYLRPAETERALPSALANDPASRLRAERMTRSMIAWANLTDALVVNPPAAMAVNNSKPHQLRLIAQCGFSVPDTLVTTEPAAVRSFAARHGRIIYKSVSGTRSIVNVLDDAGAERINHVANAPTQFQEYVPGRDIRVHVVGSELFATEVHSAAPDYRYAGLQGHDVMLAATDIPAAIAQRCRSMASAMKLAVAGIDLRCTPSGEFVCFEVNPSPAFVYYEQATGQPIGAAIAKLLIQADCGS